MSVAPPTRLGPYEILAPIGAGGMGEVYRARDLTLKRDVALKLLPPSFANDPSRMARFMREAEVLASLNHPNIAHIYGIAQSGEVRGLAMEFAEGESPKGPTPFEHAWHIASQIAAALEYAHDHGVIHRDLKPANVKVTPDGTVKLLDFGLAKAFTPECEGRVEASPESSPTVTTNVTQAGMILGTAAYMSPEQARGKNVDKRADIWAFGVMLYELLTGERPFKGEDIGDTLAAIIKQEPDLSRVPVRARDLLRSCLEKDPKKRLRDIGDAWRLLAVAEDVPVHSTRRTLPWIATAALAVVAAAAGGWLLHKSRASNPQVLRLAIEPPEGGKFALDAGASGMAISPDGTTLTYIASGRDGINCLWIRVLSERFARQLPGTEDAKYPFWSPDGNTVAFFNNSKLMRIDRNGSGLQTITDTASGRGGAWLPDGRIIFGSYFNYLSVVPAIGGKATPFTAARYSLAPEAQLWPQALAGGRLMYFVRVRNRPEENAAYIVSLNKPEVRSRLVNVPESPVYVPGSGKTDYLLLQRGTALVAQALDRETLKLTGRVAMLADPVSSGGIEGQIYATASKHGPLVYSGIPRLTQFTWFDRTGRVLGTVGAPGAYHFGSFRISPNGRTVAASLDEPGWAQMGLLEIERGIFNVLPPSGNNAFPAWGPNSLRLAYGREILDLPIDSSIQLPGNPWDWSSDGRQLLCRRLIEGVRNEILVQAVTPEDKLDGAPRVFAEGAAARFSPNRQWVAFLSSESGEDEVYVDAFPNPGRKVRISTAGGNFPVWSSDGREIYYVAPGNRLMAVRLKITAGSPQPAAPQELFVLPISDTPGFPFDVAKDGRFLVRADVPQASNSLTAIVNWGALIK